MTSETNISDPGETGDRQRLQLRTGPDPDDYIYVWNLSGHPLRFRGNQGEGELIYRPVEKSPRRAGRAVELKEELDRFSDTDNDDWAVIAPDVAAVLKRGARSCRLATYGDEAGFPLLIDGSRELRILFRFGFNVKPVSDKLARLLEDMDFSTTDAAAVAVQV